LGAILCAHNFAGSLVLLAREAGWGRLSRYVEAELKRRSPASELVAKKVSMSFSWPRYLRSAMTVMLMVLIVKSFDDDSPVMKITHN
jgi:hypothetical protein